MPRKLYEKIEDDKKDEIIKKYISGLSIDKLQEIYPQYGRNRIYRMLKENCVMRNDSEKSRKYSYNKDVFKVIDTEEKAYWLGFIYADGYIVNGIKGKNNDSLGITLSNKDKEHIEKFKKSIDSNHPIRIYKSKYGSNSARIIIQDEELVADLIELGVLRNKSLILKFPTTDVVDKSLIYHFIRGYFDGDGSFKKKGQKLNGYDFSVLGTIEFLTELRTYLGVDNEIRKCNKNNDSNNYHLTFGGNRKVKQVANMLYGNANIYLDRKYKRYREIENM